MSTTARVCAVVLYIRVLTVSCGQAAESRQTTVWPQPQYVNYSSSYSFINPHEFTFSLTDKSCDVLLEAIDRYKHVVEGMSTPSESKARCGPGSTLDTVRVHLAGSCEHWPHVRMKENYKLMVNGESSVIWSETVWGILRGLETFSQLVSKAGSHCLIISHTNITDYPRFRHRGLLLDTSRHYLPLPVILNILSGMEIDKLNVLHWHIVDDESFPYQSFAFPSLSDKGAYDPKRLIYTQENIKTVINYARLRGIRVIPEFNSPGHTRSWGKGEKKLLTQCFAGNLNNGEVGPIDPSRRQNYKFMETLLKEVKTVFLDDFIHIGGDKINLSCWKSNLQINKFMQEIQITSYKDLEVYYIKKILDILNDINATALVSQDVFLNNANLRQGTVVQIREGKGMKLMAQVTSKGHLAILSKGWDLSRLGEYFHQDQWEDFYRVNPTAFNGTKEQMDLVLGGEACMWGEMVDETNVVARIWPRTSAVAERLWSSTEVNYQYMPIAASRLFAHVCWMKKRGIAASPSSGPGFCPS